jgi:hypothetical protein
MTEVPMVSPRTLEAGAATWQFPVGIVKPSVPPEVVAVRETRAKTEV